MEYARELLTVLETNRERNTGSEFTMELGLGSACTDRAPGHDWVKFSKKIVEGKRGWERRIEWTYDQPHTVVKWYQEARNQQVCQGL